MPSRPMTAPYRQQRPTTTPRSDYSRAILEGGANALTNVRQQRNFGIDSVAPGGNSVSNATQAFAPRQYRANAPTSVDYQNWVANYVPTSYQVLVGRGDGKYGGFETQSMLQDATRGLARQLQDESRYQFDALEQLANDRLDTLASNYNDAKAPIAQSVAQAKYFANLNARQDDIQAARTSRTQPATQTLRTPFTALNDAASRIGSQLRARQALTSANTFAEDVNRYYKDTLDPWLAQTSERELALLDMAQQGQYAPLSVFGARAAAEYGVDPNIARDWFTLADDQANYEQLRAQDVFLTTGFYPDDYQAALDEVQRIEQAQIDAADTNFEMQQELADAYADEVVVRETGLDATALSQSVDIPKLELAALIDSDQFRTARDRLAGIVSSDDTDDVKSERFAAYLQDELATDLRNLPLIETLMAVYAEALPYGFELYGRQVKP